MSLTIRPGDERPFEFVEEEAAPLCRDHLAGFEAGDDLGVLVVPRPGPDRADVERLRTVRA